MSTFWTSLYNFLFHHLVTLYPALASILSVPFKQDFLVATTILFSLNMHRLDRKLKDHS